MRAAAWRSRRAVTLGAVAAGRARQAGDLFGRGLANASISVYFVCINSREILKAIEAAGWHHVATKGDHWQFRHPTRPGRVKVPHPKRDLPIGTLRSIEKQAGVKLR